MINKELLPTEIQEIIKKCKLRHIAIIMDGNRRWAKKNHFPSASGHHAGVKSLKNTINLLEEWGIKYLTIYAFSTENWGRKKEEVNFLMLLLRDTMIKELNELHSKNVKIRIIGNLEQLNSDLKAVLKDAMEKTACNTGLSLQIAINYGSRDEICKAVANIANEIKAGLLQPEDITPELISGYLYTQGIPDPDLLIRTGGDSRLSNYLLWQSAYTEIFITQTLWPDFEKAELENAIYEFANRERRFGRD